MTRGTARWLGVLGVGLTGVLLVVYLLGRSGPSGEAPSSRTRAPKPPDRQGPPPAPVVAGSRVPAPPRSSAPRAVPAVPWPAPEASGAARGDAGAAPPDRFAPPEDQFTFNPRMQARLAAMGVNERRIWTERIIGNLENRVKAVDGRIQQYEADGNARAAHGERITRGRITDGIAALRRQLERIDRVLPRRAADAGVR